MHVPPSRRGGSRLPFLSFAVCFCPLPVVYGEVRWWERTRYIATSAATRAVSNDGLRIILRPVQHPPAKTPSRCSGRSHVVEVQPSSSPRCAAHAGQARLTGRPCRLMFVQDTASSRQLAAGPFLCISKCGRDPAPAIGDAWSACTRIIVLLVTVHLRAGHVEYGASPVRRMVLAAGLAWRCT